MSLAGEFSGLLPNSVTSRALEGTGGMLVTQEMLEILAQPGFISVPKGSERLRKIFGDRESPSTYLTRLPWLNLVILPRRITGSRPHAAFTFRARMFYWSS